MIFLFREVLWCFIVKAKVYSAKFQQKFAKSSFFKFPNYFFLQNVPPLQCIKGPGKQGVQFFTSKNVYISTNGKVI